MRDFLFFPFFCMVCLMSRSDLVQNVESYFIPIANGGLPKAGDYHKDVYEGSGYQRVSSLKQVQPNSY